MSIDDDVALLERVPTLRLLGRESLRMLAIGSEQKEVPQGDFLFRQGDDADSGFVIQRGIHLQFSIGSADDGGRKFLRAWRV